MAFFEQDKGGVSIWMPIVSGPVFSLVAFVLTYWLDPLSLKQTSAIPAFFLSVIVLMIAQWWVTVGEVRKTAAYSDRLYDAIKDYLHVTPIGSPEQGLRYIQSRLPILREVKNTSFNTEESMERSDEKFYATQVYDELLRGIAQHVRRELIWKDIGDARALKRFRQVHQGVGVQDLKHSGKYKYKIIAHTDPQLNFILLEHIDGIKEVMFNWDYRGLGQDPTVLISRDSHIIEMFTKQFNLLWQSGAPDHDTIATKSVPEK